MKSIRLKSMFSTKKRIAAVALSGAVILGGAGIAAAFFTSALTQYRDDVAAHRFPSDAESYHLSREVQSADAAAHPRARKA